MYSPRQPHPRRARGVDANYLDLRRAGSGFGEASDRFPPAAREDDVPLASIDIRGFLGAAAPAGSKAGRPCGAPGAAREAARQPRSSATRTGPEGRSSSRPNGHRPRPHAPLTSGFKVTSWWRATQVAARQDRPRFLGLTIPPSAGRARLRPARQPMSRPSRCLGLRSTGWRLTWSVTFKRQIRPVRPLRGRARTAWGRCSPACRSSGGAPSTLRDPKPLISGCDDPVFQKRKVCGGSRHSSVAARATSALLRVLVMGQEPATTLGAERSRRRSKRFIDATLSRGQVAVATADAAYGISSKATSMPHSRPTARTTEVSLSAPTASWPVTTAKDGQQSFAAFADLTHKRRSQ